MQMKEAFYNPQKASLSFVISLIRFINKSKMGFTPYTTENRENCFHSFQHRVN